VQFTASALAKSTTVWIGAAVVFTFQTVYHTVRFFNGVITWQQLAKYTVVNAVAGTASAGGGIGGAAVSAAVGTLICPVLGTIIGGM
jgi:hypothetical protein